MAKKKARKKKPQTVSEVLIQAIENAWDNDVTTYRIGKNSDVDPGTIDRFVSGERPNIRIETVDRLAEGLGLDLKPKK